MQKIEVNSGVNANKTANEHSLVFWLTTSCEVLRLDGAVVDTHSRKQTLIATSTAEAEMYGILSVTFEGVSIRSLFTRVGVVELTTMTDSDAGRAVCSRKVWGS